MNNPKLTNVLLIALVVVNCFLLIGWSASRHHRMHNERMWMSYRMQHMHRFGGWAFHHHRGFNHHGINGCPCGGDEHMRNM